MIDTKSVNCTICVLLKANTKNVVFTKLINWHGVELKMLKLKFMKFNSLNDCKFNLLIHNRFLFFICTEQLDCPRYFIKIIQVLQMSWFSSFFGIFHPCWG